MRNESHTFLFRALLLSALIFVAAFPGATSEARAQSPKVVKTIRPEFSQVPDHIPNFLPFRSVKRPKVAVILSGGGARGIASIGVLKVLEDADIAIDLIA